MIVSNEQTLDQEQRRREEECACSVSTSYFDLCAPCRERISICADILIKRDKLQPRYEYRDLTTWGSDLRDGEEALGREYATRQAISDAQGRK